MALIFSERTWDQLLTQIEERKIIPVVGQELLLINIDGKDTLLYQYLAEELAKRLELEIDALDEISLNEIACAYVKQNGDLEDVYYQLKKIIDSRTWPIPGSLKKLAAVTHFDLYLSTTFDPFMKQALDVVRFAGADKIPTLAYSTMEAMVDLPAKYRQQPTPLVYHLFGRYKGSRDYAVTEDDMLQFNHRLQSKDLRPENLFDLMRTHYLLNLGCCLPDWLARFFFCAAKGDQLFSGVGIHGVVADEILRENKHLAKFFERKRTQIYGQGDALHFVDQLYDRWIKRFGGNTVTSTADALPSANEPAPPAPESIFLSYASEDLEKVITLKTALEAKGIDVWFDKRRLDPGDVWISKIRRYIELCPYFIPVISQHTLTNKRRVFHYEWNKAIEESKLYPKGYPFIQPVAIDNTPENCPNIPEEFRERHWQRFPDGKPTEEFLQITRQRIRDLRSKKRDQSNL